MQSTTFSSTERLRRGPEAAAWTPRVVSGQWDGVGHLRAQQLVCHGTGSVTCAHSAGPESVALAHSCRAKASSSSWRKALCAAHFAIAWAAALSAA
jgi:hypothetical protein